MKMLLLQLRSVLLCGLLFGFICRAPLASTDAKDVSSNGPLSLPSVIEQVNGTTWCIHLSRQKQPGKLAIRILELRFMPVTSAGGDATRFNGVMRFQVEPWAIDVFAASLPSDEMTTKIQEIRWEATRSAPAGWETIKWPTYNRGIALMLFHAFITPCPPISVDLPPGTGTVDVHPSPPRNAIIANATTAFELSTGGKLVHEKGRSVRWEMTQALSLVYNTYLFPAAGTLFREWTVNQATGRMVKMLITLNTHALDGYSFHVTQCR